jgi:hypothetical protein
VIARVIPGGFSGSGGLVALPYSWADQPVHPTGEAFTRRRDRPIVFSGGSVVPDSPNECALSPQSDAERAVHETAAWTVAVVARAIDDARSR